MDAHPHDATIWLSGDQQPNMHRFVWPTKFMSSSCVSTLQILTCVKQIDTQVTSIPSMCGLKLSLVLLYPRTRRNHKMLTEFQRSPSPQVPTQDQPRTVDDARIQTP